MSRFKKCQMHYCNNVATKQIEIQSVLVANELGKFHYAYQSNNTNSEWIEERLKKHKYKVCNICYETVEPDDFRVTYSNGQRYEVELKRL